jgi:hypothetical protein
MATSSSAVRDSEKTIQVSPAYRPWMMLFGRTALFLSIQALFALALYLVGSQSAWDDSTSLWPFAVTLANFICMAALVRFYRTEGKNYWDIFHIRRENLKGDLLALLGCMLIAGPAGYFPNILLANWLFGDPQKALALFVRPLPLWAAYTSILLFPITQGLVEIALYFRYAMPRLQSQGLPHWWALAISALMLGLQHFAIPFVFDLRFIAWRALMFIPFAFVVGIMLLWRPRLLPYVAVIHVLMDASFAAMLLSVAY